MDFSARTVSFALKQGEMFDPAAAIKALEERGNFKGVKRGVT
jgi:hypothetical protein